jgi:hypothetical protein
MTPITALALVRLVACQVGRLLNVLLSTRIEYQGQFAWAIVTR